MSKAGRTEAFLSTGLRGRRSDDDAGVALVVSVALIGLVSILMLTIVGYALRENASSGRDRQRSSAVMTAEGSVDAMLARIQSSAPGSLPCGTQPPVTVAQAVPDTLVSTTAVTYYDAAGAQVACGSVATAPVAQARVVSVVESTPVAGRAPARRAMETLVRLTPTFAHGLDKAIFGSAGVQLANHGEVFGRNGAPDADVYTNGDFTCNNNQRYHGSVYAQGSITLAGTCTIDVDAHARTGFRADNSGVSVSGRVLVSHGGASLVRHATVSQQVRTSGAISWDSCTPTKCFPATSVEPPPSQPFPVLNWNPTVRAEWAANGYPNVVENNDCALTGDANGPGRWIMTNAASTSRGKTVLVTNCQVVIQGNNNTVALAEDLAVFARGGVSFRNSLTIRSTTTAQRRLYLVQPYDSVPSPCTSDGITLDNRVTIESTVDELIYTPCSIRKANNSDHYGQLYAGGRVVIDNRLTMFYRPLPVWGVTAPTTTVSSYSLDVAYKRETRQ